MFRSRTKKESKSLSSPNSKATFQLPGILLIVGLIVIGVVARFLPYPPNFSPIGAIALFAGATLGSRLRAALIPLTAMFLSDLWLGMHTLMPVVYGCFLFNVWLGSRIQSRLRPAAHRWNVCRRCGLLLYRYQWCLLVHGLSRNVDRDGFLLHPRDPFLSEYVDGRFVLFRCVVWIAGACSVAVFSITSCGIAKPRRDCGALGSARS